MKKPISSLIAMLLLLSFITVFPTTAQVQTVVRVENPLTGDNIFYFEQEGDGGYCRNFTAKVMIYNVTNLKTFQIVIDFNETILEVVEIDRANTAPDHIFYGRVTIDAPETINYTEINELGYILLGSTIFSGSPATGSGRAFTVTFHIIQNVTKTSPTLTDTLDIVTSDTFYTYLLDPDDNEMPYTAEDGLFTLQWVEIPLPKPYLKIYPPLTELGVPMGPSIIGTPKAFFTIDIVIKNVVQERKLIGVQSAVIYYPTDLVQLVDSWEGPFLASYAPYGTLWINATDPGSITIGVVMWPNPATGEYDWTDFPQGEGVIATIKFEVIKQEEYPWIGEGVFNCTPLFGEYFLDANEEWIPYLPEEDGYFRITGWVLGRMIDLYICEYPFPYGGQGLNQTADMFEPQKTVCLCANVTYNMDPVQHKLVTFEIRGPINDVYNHTFIRTNFTDENGVVCISFGLPWPCENPEKEIFGEWTVVASVDIRCTIVKDWLWFKVWWEVEITDVIPKQTSYAKCNNAEFEIYFRTYRMQAHWALIFITVYDDLDVPIGKDMVWVYVGWDTYRYCEFWTGNVTLWVHIPKWAFVGVGKVYANVLSTYPFECGHALGPEESATFDISR